MEACAISLFGEPEYAGLVRVALRAMGCASLYGGCERRSCLATGGGAEDDRFIVTCIHSRLRWVAPVESLDCVFCIVEVFCRVRDFIVFWRAAFPLSSVLELVGVESRVDDLREFAFVFSFYLDRRKGFFDL